MPLEPLPIPNSYQTFPFYAGVDSGCTNAVYLLPPTFSYGQSLTLDVTGFYTGDSNYASYTYANSDFQFALVPTLGSASPTPPYQSSVMVKITVLGNNNLWKCAESARQALMTNFLDFFTQIENQFELGNGVLIPGAAWQLSQYTAQVMPCSFEESLYFRFSFISGNQPGTSPYIDLIPGMQIKVELEASQFISPGSTMNGYLVSGQCLYTVTSVPILGSLHRNLVLDPFWGTIAPPQVSGSGTVPVVAGGLLDLQQAGMAKQYLRLFIPQTVETGNSPGNLSVAQNVAIIGANTMADMNTATQLYVTSGQCGAPNTTCIIFRGRATVTPQIQVFIGALNSVQSCYVPVGTTVINLLERYTAYTPLYTGQNLIAFHRLMLTTTNAQNPNSQMPAYTNVTFYQNSYKLPVNDLRVFDLPLVPGDNLTLNFPTT